MTLRTILVPRAIDAYRIALHPSSPTRQWRWGQALRV
jgi:hypothetical protein